MKITAYVVPCLYAVHRPCGFTVNTPGVYTRQISILYTHGTYMHTPTRMYAFTFNLHVYLQVYVRTYVVHLQRYAHRNTYVYTDVRIYAYDVHSPTR
jgi:hypothetical protein